MSRPAGIYDVKYGQDMAIVRTGFQWGVLIAFLLFLGVLPLFASPYLLGIMNVMAIMIIAALGLNITTGYAGQISLGTAAFVAVGAYTTAVLMDSFGWNFWLTIPLAGIFAALIGMVFGLPSLRLKLFYLAMSTLAAQFLLLAFFSHTFEEYFHGIHGIVVDRPSVMGIQLVENSQIYYLIVGMTVLMTFFAKNLVRGRLGRAFVAVRDNDLAAEITGISLFKYKVYAFAIGCFYAGIAGSLWAVFMRIVSPTHFVFEWSVFYLGCLIVGGMGTTVGPIYGVIMLRGIKELVTILAPFLGELVDPATAPAIGPSLGLISWAMLVVLFLIFEPRGLAHTWEVVKARMRHWPFTYGA